MKEREKFEDGMELYRQMLYGVINKLKAMDIENIYILILMIGEKRFIIVAALKQRIL